MAIYARGAQACKFVIHVASGASNRRMFSGQGKLGCAVIE